MQLLTFSVAGESYAIPSRMVIEVLPLVPVRPIPLMPDFCLGVFSYRGTLVPLIDLGLRFGGPRIATAGTGRLSTRVIVVEFSLRGDAALPSGPSLRLGVAAEDVVAVCSDDAAESSLPAMDLGRAPFLGRLLKLSGRTVQVLLVEKLLPPDLVAGLCQTDSGAND
jgi:chemotaxis-related protein WspB